MDPSKYLDWLKLEPKHVFGFLVICLFTLGFLVWAPDDTLGSLGLSNFREDYR